jgi:leader peptidase (prepilin peptidase) / N-methyltransferase
MPLMLLLSLVFVFVVGACVGSFINVAVARLPLEKSLLWPSSRCGTCWQPIHWYDNVPIVSYLWLRGRCRACGQSFSVAYMLVELATALGIVGLFWLEVVMNVHDWPGRNDFNVAHGWYPATAWLGFGWHALLFSFLMVASVCDLKSREIPLQLTLTGTLVGLFGAVLMPWPFPHSTAMAPSPGLADQGLYAWPFWFPLPAWAAPGDNWQTGLATGVVGALVGTFLLRAIGFIFGKGLGKEGLGLGDADLMMMAGAFLGWQIVFVAFFLSVFPALVFGIMNLVIRRDNSLPFGPSLSFSVLATCLCWQPIGAHVAPALFWGQLLFWGGILCGGVLYLMAFAMRLARGQAGA